MLIDRSGGSNKSVTASAPVEIVINRAMRATVQILGSLMHHRAPAKIRGYLALPTFLQKRDQLILLISAGALTAYLAERRFSQQQVKGWALAIATQVQYERNVNESVHEERHTVRNKIASSK